VDRASRKLDAHVRAYAWVGCVIRSANAVINAFDDAGNVIETHQHKGDFKEGS